MKEKTYKKAPATLCGECGKRFIPLLDNVKRGKGKFCSRSCGAKQGAVHGLSGTPFYRAWRHMKERCSNPRNKVYHLYGRRGISYDPKWESFIQFYKDMANSYQAGMELERVDNNLGYSLQNCKWATRKEQTNNTRRSVRLVYMNKVFTYLELAEFLNINPNTLRYRVLKGLIPATIKKPSQVI